MATLTIADLDNGKRDLETVDAVANSPADSTTTRFGDSVLTLAGVLRRLGYQAPVPYAPGLSVDSGLFTVSHDGVIYAPDPEIVPFVTGTWNPAQWRVVQNTANSNQVYQFPTLGATQAAAATLPEGSAIIVEGQSQGHVVGGAYAPISGTPAESLAGYSDFDAYAGSSSRVQLTDSDVAGLWVKTLAAKTPNIGTVREIGGEIWERAGEGPIFSTWFEIKDGQECSAGLQNFFAAAADNGRQWVLGYGEFAAATLGAVQIKTSGVAYGVIDAPKSNTGFRLEIVRDAAGSVVDTSSWNALLSRGECDVGAANANGKNLFMLSTEVLMERIGSGGVSYKKQEMIRVGGGGSFTTALTCTYNSKANLTVTAYDPSHPIDVTLNVKRSGTVVSPSDRGSIVVSRDNVTLRPSVLSEINASPLPVAIEVSYCADCTVEKPVIQGFQFDGLGYGILAGTTIGLTVNQPDIRDCRHAFTAAFDVDTILNGGTYSHSIDSHWTNRFVANNVRVYAPVGGAPFGFAGYDVEVNSPQVFGGRSLLVIRNDTPSLGGKVVINNPTVISRGYYSQYYLFGYSSIFGPGETLPVFTNAPELPAELTIRNASVSANTDVIYGVFIPAMNAPHVGLGLCKLDGFIRTNVLTIGIIYTKRSSVQSRSSELVVDADCDFRQGSALYLSTGDADTTGAASCVIGRGVRNADLRFSPNAVLTIAANGGSLNNIELDSPIAFSNQQYVFNSTKMAGGFVRSALKQTAFIGANFSGTYSQFPAAADVTLVGCVRSAPQGALPADIRANVVAPFA